MAWLVRITRVLILAASTLGIIWQAGRTVYGALAASWGSLAVRNRRFCDFFGPDP